MAARNAESQQQSSRPHISHNDFHLTSYDPQRHAYSNFSLLFLQLPPNTLATISSAYDLFRNIQPNKANLWTDWRTGNFIEFGFVQERVRNQGIIKIFRQTGEGKKKYCEKGKLGGRYICRNVYSQNSFRGSRCHSIDYKCFKYLT